MIYYLRAFSMSESEGGIILCIIYDFLNAIFRSNLVPFHTQTTDYNKKKIYTLKHKLKYCFTGFL